MHIDKNNKEALVIMIDKDLLIENQKAIIVEILLTEREWASNISVKIICI